MPGAEHRRHQALLHRKSPTPQPTHCPIRAVRFYDEPSALDWISNLDGMPYQDDQDIEQIDEATTLADLDIDTDKKVTLEDFLRWADDTQLDIDELRQAVRRRESEPAIKTKRMTLGARQRSSTAPHSRSISRAPETPPRRTAESALRRIITADRHAHDTPNDASPPHIKIAATRTLGRAVRSTIHPIKRVASLRVRRPSSAPRSATTEGRSHDRLLGRRRSLADGDMLSYYAHTQPHNRCATQPHVSLWAHNVRRASSSTVVPRNSRAAGDNTDKSDCHMDIDIIEDKDVDKNDSGVAFYGSDHHRCRRHASPPPIEALDDDVSSSYSGALDLLTAEEYLRQTAFDGFEAWRLRDAGRSDSDLDD